MLSSLAGVPPGPRQHWLSLSPRGRRPLWASPPDNSCQGQIAVLVAGIPEHAPLSPQSLIRHPKSRCEANAVAAAAVSADVRPQSPCGPSKRTLPLPRVHGPAGTANEVIPRTPPERCGRQWRGVRHELDADLGDVIRALGVDGARVGRTKCWSQGFLGVGQGDDICPTNGLGLSRGALRALLYLKSRPSTNRL